MGLNVTLIVQLFPTAREVPQLLVWAKSPPFVPVRLIEVMVNAALPELLRVTTLAGLVVPTAWLAKETLTGKKATEGAIPVPLRGRECGLPLALSFTEMFAVRMPAAVGLKVVVMEQDAPGATDVPQVLVCA